MIEFLVGLAVFTAPFLFVLLVLEHRYSQRTLTRLITESDRLAAAYRLLSDELGEFLNTVNQAHWVEQQLESVAYPEMLVYPDPMEDDNPMDAQ